MESEDRTAPKRDPLEVLKGFGGILPNKVIFATPPIFKEVYPNDPSKWPVYKIKPSDGLDFNEDVDAPNLYEVVDGRAISKPGRIRVHKLKRSLKDAKNHTADGQVVPFTLDEKGEVSDDFIRSMSPDLQNWILGIIAGAEAVTKEESDGLKF